MTRKAIIAIVLLLLLGGVLRGSYELAKDYRFNSDAPEADYLPPADLAEARAQDVEHLELFFELERSLKGEALQNAMTEYQGLDEVAAELTIAQFDLAVARIVARAGNAHTKVREYNRTPRYSRLPIRGYVFADGYYVVRAREGYESLLGARIDAIDGRPMQQITSELSEYIAGPIGTQKKYLPYLLESPDLLHAAGLVDAPDRVRLTVVAPDGVESETVFSGEFPDSSEHIARAHLLLAPRVYAKSQPQWKSLHAPSEETPLYLRKPIEAFQTAEIPELDAFYIQFWSNSDAGGVSIRKFCEEALERFRANPRPVLIVDHRFNSGGNFGLTDECMTELGSSVPDAGHVYIVIGGATFSAGIYSVAFLKQAAGEKAILVGEPVGDELVSWAEDNLLRLPNSGIEIKFSTGKHDLVNGCDDWKECHWGVLGLDLRVSSLKPDLDAPLTFEDYANQVDPAMAAIRIHESGLLAAR